MSIMSAATVGQILKELYVGQKVTDMTYKDNPFLAMVKKEEKFSGKYIPIPVKYGNSQGASSTFASAYNNQTSNLVAEFLVTKISDFSIASIDGQMYASASDDLGAFVNGLEFLIDGAWDEAVTRLASALFRNGAGTIAQILTVTSLGGTSYLITLANPDDNVQFDVGQTLVAIQFVDGSGTAPTDTALVTQVDRNLGTLTVTSATNIVTDWPTLYFLATQGDLPSATNNNFQPNGSTLTNSLLRLSGLAAWIPVGGPPVSDSFFGVNRNLDNTRLAGISFNGTALSIEEAVLKGSAKMFLQGAKPDIGVCSAATYNALVTSLGSKLVYIDQKVGAIGFRGVEINGAAGVIHVFPDRSCPDGLMYLLELDTWCLRSAGGAPHILSNVDGIEILRIPQSDSYELRVGSYMQFYTTKPGRNGVVQVQVAEFV